MLTMPSHDLCDAQIDDSIGVHNDERRVLEERFGFLYGAARIEDCRFLGIRERDTIAGAVPQLRSDRSSEMVQIDDDLENARSPKQSDRVGDHGMAADGYQWFRDGFGQRSKTSSETGCQDHGPHRLISGKYLPSTERSSTAPGHSLSRRSICRSVGGR